MKTRTEATVPDYPTGVTGDPCRHDCVDGVCPECIVAVARLQEQVRVTAEHLNRARYDMERVLARCVKHHVNDKVLAGLLGLVLHHHDQALASAPAAEGKGCVCGGPLTLGVVHRLDGPCYHAPAAEGETLRLPAGQETGAIGKVAPGTRLEVTAAEAGRCGCKRFPCKRYEPTKYPGERSWPGACANCYCCESCHAAPKQRGSE